MRIDNLIQIMQSNNISLPCGTGRRGKIVARDLENAIGDYYLTSVVRSEQELAHMALRREWTPMKAYRYNKLNKAAQSAIFEDDNDWYAERKHNGWKMMVTFIHDTTPMFWGGNLSTVNFLPTNYTQHILFKTIDEPDGIPVDLSMFNNIFPNQALILDCEVVVQDKTEDLSEHASLIQVQEILGSSPDRARMLQANSTLIFKVVDVIIPTKPNTSYYDRKLELLKLIEVLDRRKDIQQFELVPFYACNKKRYVNTIWKEGGEGIILKKGSSKYVPASRKKEIQVKVKRTHSGMVGDDIDAYITHIYDTPEWSKKGLIGGIELTVSIEGTPHIIAAVTSMPDNIREDITNNPSDWLDQVVVVDGQELSARNRRLLHASVDWERGRRIDKSPLDCVMELQEIDGVKF